uniref:Protein kinase domain-containing protein n=1 Tax=Globodera rostochiensis TaxID=31243 RepID=A0A914IF21_GLORO
MSNVNLAAGMNIAHLQVARCLGSGSYGDVYLCRNEEGDEFAVKIEEMGKKQLDFEITVYEKLAAVLPTNFCRFFSSGITEICSSDGRNLMVKYLVSNYTSAYLLWAVHWPNFLLDCNGQFSPGTAIGASIQLLDAIDTLYDLGFVHCDVKMENMAIGRSDSERRRLYLFDFGHAHSAVNYSRKIDIEPWFYLTVRMFYGQLGQRSLDEILPQCPPELQEIYSHIAFGTEMPVARAPCAAATVVVPMDDERRNIPLHTNLLPVPPTKRLFPLLVQSTVPSIASRSYASVYKAMHENLENLRRSGSHAAQFHSRNFIFENFNGTSIIYCRQCRSYSRKIDIVPWFYEQLGRGHATKYCRNVRLNFKRFIRTLFILSHPPHLIGTLCAIQVFDLMWSNG